MLARASSATNGSTGGAAPAACGERTETIHQVILPAPDHRAQLPDFRVEHGLLQREDRRRVLLHEAHPVRDDAEL